MALAGEPAVLALALFVIIAVASIGYAISTVQLLGRLETHHRQVYEALGKPGVYVANWYDWIQVMPFIWRRDYSAIRDPVVTRWGQWARATLVIWACAFVLFFVVFAALGE
jgi:hypothetical protein